MTIPGKGIQMEKIRGNLGGKQKDIAMGISHNYSHARQIVQRLGRR
jgi:hypothetical protein